MRINWTWRIIFLALGILIGVTGGHAYHTIRNKNRAEDFQQKLRCKTLAEAYVKRNTNSYDNVLLDQSGFSHSRNSCVASDTAFDSLVERFEVVDIVTGENLYLGSCNEKDAGSQSFCGNGRDVALLQQRDAAFGAAVR